MISAPTTIYFQLCSKTGAYLDRQDHWQTLPDYGLRYDSLASVRHNITRLRAYGKSELAEQIAGCIDARGRFYPMEELFR